jgi:hypothetical protein
VCVTPFFSSFVYGKLLATVLTLENDNEHENLFRQTC